MPPAWLVPLNPWLKVPFGLCLTIGIMALIPFGGTVGIVLTTVLVALQDVWLGLRVLIAAEFTKFLRTWLPQILGSVTGLNPVWVLVSVLTGAVVGCWCDSGSTTAVIIKRLWRLAFLKKNYLHLSP